MGHYNTQDIPSVFAEQPLPLLSKLHLQRTHVARGTLYLNYCPSSLCMNQSKIPASEQGWHLAWIPKDQITLRYFTEVLSMDDVSCSYHCACRYGEI